MQRRALQHITLRSRWPLILRLSQKPLSSKSNTSSFASHDSCGIPTQPTWSVNELLSSYPQPSLPPSTLRRLHELSALIPPSEGTPEHARLTREMEGLVKLVEAVKLVDTSSLQAANNAPIPDGRIGKEGQGIDLEEQRGTRKDHNGEVNGRELLRHSTRVRDGLYIVDADKRR